MMLRSTHLIARHFLALLALLITFSLSAQENYQLKFKSETVLPPANAVEAMADENLFSSHEFLGNSYLLLQFEEIPSEKDQAHITSLGIDLIDYIPQYAYLASIPSGITEQELKTLGLRAIIPVEAHWKLGDYLADNMFPDWAIPVEGSVDVFVQYHPAIPQVSILKTLAKLPYVELLEESSKANYLTVRVKNDKYYELAAHPWVSYVEVIPAPAEPEDKRGRSLQRANVVNSDYPAGRHYDGSGVNILVRDDGIVGPHIDFQGRLTNLTTDATGTHGDGVGGIMGGTGNLDPYYRGMASGANVYVINYASSFLDNTLSLHQNDGVMITNSSYSNGCNAGYTSITRTVDQQIRQNPSLMHVFSGGNSNNNDCGYGAGNQWGNITGGHKQGKNVITTANLYADDVLVGSSSRGPAHDGRIKPDMAAHGQGQGSTSPNNGYMSFGGTSAAAPSLAGTLTTLYEAYKTLNAGSNPESSLMKAIMMNTCDDLGNPGPDYKFGWGRINAGRAIKLIENTQYLTSTISQSGVNNHTLNVPSGVSQVRIMVYWMEREAAVNASTALINDLDMLVTAPNTNTYNPWILNPAPNATTLDLPATRGADHLNNVEQVTLDSPPAGNYNIRIDGTTVPFGPQKYYIVYEYVTDDITVIYPLGGEGFVPNETERLHWDAFGTAGNFTLEYSVNNGASWNLITNSVSGNARLYDWAVPNSVTGEALIRVTRGAESDISDAVFSIIDDPNNLTVTDLCTGGVTVSWNPVSGATSYEVFMLGTKYMDVIGTTAVPSFSVFGLTNGNTYWFSVRAVMGPGEFGRRAIAVSHTPNGSGICPIDDLTMGNFVAPVDIGRSCAGAGFSATEQVSVFIQNSGISNLNNPVFYYQLNGGSVVSETYSGTLNSGAVFTYNFSTTADLSTGNSHMLKAWLAHPSDINVTNDTISTTVQSLSNPVVTLPFTEDFESTTSATYQSSLDGLVNLTRADFQTSVSNLGRLRTDMGTGFQTSGNRAMTMDVSTTGNYAINYLILNFNLSAYAGTNDLLMDFSYMHHSEEGNPNDKVWVREGPSFPWVEIYDWYANRAAAGVYSNVTILDVSGALARVGQVVGCNFQVRFGQEDNFSATSTNATDGLTIDDVTLYLKGLEVNQVLSPVTSTNCLPLSTNENITVRIVNQSSVPYANVNLFYQVNGGATVQEVVPVVGGFSFVDHTFATQVNLSALGTYNIDTWVGQVDDYTANDTIRNYTVTSRDVVATFPYLQTFEAGPAGWTTNGTNSSWAWGTPTGTVISKAASGTNAWVTSLTGDHNDLEVSYLESPCFDLSGFAADPVLSFSFIHELEDTYDFGWLEYSQGGVNWVKLGAIGNGFNWYGYTGDVWNGQANRDEWRLASYVIPKNSMANASSVRFRFVMQSDQFVVFEGLGIDDIHIHANDQVYDGNSTVGLAQNVSGSGWVDFNLGGDKIISIDPRGQNLGNTSVNVYFSNTGVRNFGNKYYHDRNLVVNTTNPVTSPVGVRFYYLDTEVWDLYTAAGCGACATIPDLYTLGVSKYDGINEDGDVANSTDPGFIYIPSTNISIVPYNNGYWLDFDVTGFSELWINPGGPLGTPNPFPIEWLAFDAKANGNDAHLIWATTSEVNNHGFFVEHAAPNTSGTPAFQTEGFVHGNGTTTLVSNYGFTVKNLQSGTHLFRLRQEDVNGNYRHSEVRELTIGASESIRVYPSPFTESLTVEVSGEIGQQVSITVMDPTGRRVALKRLIMDTGFQSIPLSVGKSLAEGVYLVRVVTAGKTVVVKVVK